MRNLILTLAVLFPALVWGQSGWVKSKGEFFVKTDAFLFLAKNYYTPLETQLTTSQFQQFTLHVYGEYGLGHRLAIQGYFPLLRVNRFETTKAVAGIGDLRVELKYALIEGKFPVAISIAPEFPTGRANAFAENKSIPNDGIYLPTGDGEFNVWTTLAASHGFGKYYVSAYTSYDLRTSYKGQAFRQLYQVGAELGYHPTSKLWLQLKYRVQGSFGESKYPDLGFVRGDATQFNGLNIGAWYEATEHIGFSAEIGSGIPFPLALRNIYGAPFYGLGVTWKGKR